MLRKQTKDQRVNELNRLVYVDEKVRVPLLHPSNKLLNRPEATLIYFFGLSGGEDGALRLRNAIYVRLRTKIDREWGLMAAAAVFKGRVIGK